MIVFVIKRMIYVDYETDYVSIEAVYGNELQATQRKEALMEQDKKQKIKNVHYEIEEFNVLGNLDKKNTRKTFRDSVFKRDAHKCVCCDITEDLDAHHIMDRHYFTNGGYVLQNGVTLCKQHHELAEVYHSSNAQRHVYNMHPDDLYKRIKSSFEMAIQADEENK